MSQPDPQPDGTTDGDLDWVPEHTHPEIEIASRGSSPTRASTAATRD
jgi:hypothetical protein